MEDLYKKLKQLNIDNVYPFHMPGHKRNLPDNVKALENVQYLKPFYDIDVTEIDGLDNLAKPQTLLKDIEDRLSDFYCSEKSFISVNGSTGGILAGIFACVKRGDHVMVARNCHKSVYHAIELVGAIPHYIIPEIDEDYEIPGPLEYISVESKITALNNANINPVALILTSPTYEGICSDIVRISHLCHANNITVIVDEAHGAHLKVCTNRYFPASAVSLGADLVIESLHKTLPAMTQTAVVHICSERVSDVALKKYLNYFQTSSPSYILLASIEACLDVIYETGNTLAGIYKNNLVKFYEKVSSLRSLKVRLPEDCTFTDPGKILICTKGCGASAKNIYDTLRIRYKLQPEMHGIDYILMMTSIFDSEDGFERLSLALNEIDTLLCTRMYRPEPTTLENNSNEDVLSYINSLKGEISTEFITPYPPGIPIIAPGEEITEEVIKLLTEFINNGITIETH